MGETDSALIEQARTWVKDCLWADIEEEDVDELPAEVVRRGVERHYAGGWAQFVEDGA